MVSSCQEPGRDHCFKLIRRKGEEILLAAEDGGELERWLAVFHRETLNNHLSQGLCLHIFDEVMQSWLCKGTRSQITSCSRLADATMLFRQHCS